MQKDRKRKKQISEGKAGYLFAAPGILGFLIFTAGPMLISLYYSFTEFSVLTKLEWPAKLYYNADVSLFSVFKIFVSDFDLCRIERSINHDFFDCSGASAES